VQPIVALIQLPLGFAMLVIAVEQYVHPVIPTQVRHGYVAVDAFVHAS